MSITTDTRLDSYNQLDKQTMYDLILNTLKEHKEEGLTAREIAIKLYDKGLIRSNERQATQPRLTELVDNNVLIVIGKRMDEITHRNVAIYTIK